MVTTAGSAVIMMSAKDISLPALAGNSSQAQLSQTTPSSLLVMSQKQIASDVFRVQVCSCTALYFSIVLGKTCAMFYYELTFRRLLIPESAIFVHSLPARQLLTSH